VKKVLGHFFSFLAGAVVFAGVGYHVFAEGWFHMDMIETREPLRIASVTNPEGVGSHALPSGVVLYRDKIMPEGQTSYLTYFYHKGRIAHEELKPDDKRTIPSWLHNITAEEAENLFKQFPLSKQDVIAAVKANKITRDDLVDILRHLP
jgi:hypothetical protein